MKTPQTLLFALFLGVCFTSHCEATVYVSDGSAQNVQYVHDNLARDGDTITLPAGTFDWTSDVRITKNITLQGQTTIGGTPQNPVINDATTILDDTPRSGAEAMIINVNVSLGARITGITFAPGAATSGVMAAVHLRGGTATAPATQMRIDHCHFAQIYSNPIWVLGWTYGVADHNVVDCRLGELSFQFWDDTYANGVNGEGAWADFPWYGTEKFFFIEDNTILTTGTSQVTGGIDCWKGGKYVARHNYFQNASPNSHGTEGGPSRGARAAEVYDNIFDWTWAQSSRELRSGGIIYHDNSWISQGATDNAHTRTAIFREVGAIGDDLTFLGIAQGQNLWDMNDPNGLYQTGTTTSGSVGTTTGTITDSSKNWMVNQWAGYSMTNTNPSSACFNHGSYIISNTATTITYYYYNSGDRGAPLVFNAGDTFSIYRVFTALDQAGHGKGDLVTYDGTGHPLNTTCSCRAWPHEQLEPCFSWNNVVTSNNGALGISSGQPTEIAGRDFYNLGIGLPPDSTPQLMATTYTAALNGIAYTGTFVYPHPLVSGDPPPTPTPTPSSPTPTPSVTPTATPTATATPRATPTATATSTATPTGTPAAPSNLSDTTMSSVEIDIAWQNNDANADYIHVERGADGINFQIITQLGCFRTSMSDSGLNAATTYYYRLRAHNANGFSDYSNVASATTLGASPTPSPSATATATPTPTPTATPPAPTPSPSPTATQSPTPTPTPTPSPTATPTPCLATAPNFVGAKILTAQSIWRSAGFTTNVITNGPPGQRIRSQSLPPGYQGACSTTMISVSD
jgi:hypothetical protein